MKVNKKTLSCNFKETKTDVFEHCFIIPCGELQTLWEIKNKIKACGSFVLSIKEVCSSVAIYVNGESVVAKPQITAGQKGDLTYSFTSGNLQKIEILCGASTDNIGNLCKIQFCLTVHYECC